MNAIREQSPETTTESARSSDWAGVGDAVAVTTKRVSAPVEGMHRAIVSRWGSLLGTGLERERETIDAAIGSAYGLVRLGGTTVGKTIGSASGLIGSHIALPPVWATGGTRYVQSGLNALWGDQLEEDQSPLRIDLALRDADGVALPATPESLRGAYPNATRRLALTIHGLGETERGWHSQRNPSLLDGLEEDGFTVLGLRYNTGRRVADNGREVAELLEAVVAAWPVTVDEIVLIGHSMGGLVARAAVHNGDSSRHQWTEAASHLVAIGTPHLGSPIEKGVEGLGRTLGSFGVTTPLAEFVATRSLGIKDLRHGTHHRPAGVQVHVIAGAVTREPTHPMGRLLGDLVVRVASATGQGKRRQVESENSAVLGGRNHARLLDDPEVIALTRSWLTTVD